jgi:hypothetical protein
MSLVGATMTPIKFVKVRGGVSIPPCKWMQKFNAFDVKTQPKTNVNPKIEMKCEIIMCYFKP